MPVIDATITRDGTLTWIVWELGQPPCHTVLQMNNQVTILLDSVSVAARVIEPRFDV